MCALPHDTPIPFSTPPYSQSPHPPLHNLLPRNLLLPLQDRLLLPQKVEFLLQDGILDFDTGHLDFERGTFFLRALGLGVRVDEGREHGCDCVGAVLCDVGGEGGGVDGGGGKGAGVDVHGGSEGAVWKVSWWVRLRMVDGYERGFACGVR